MIISAVRHHRLEYEKGASQLLSAALLKGKIQLVGKRDKIGNIKDQEVTGETGEFSEMFIKMIFKIYINERPSIDQENTRLCIRR